MSEVRCVLKRGDAGVSRLGRLGVAGGELRCSVGGRTGGYLDDCGRELAGQLVSAVTFRVTPSIPSDRRRGLSVEQVILVCHFSPTGNRRTAPCVVVPGPLFSLSVRSPCSA